MNHKPVIDIHCHLTAIGPASGGILSARTRRHYAYQALFAWYGYRFGRPDRDDVFDRRIVSELVLRIRESETTDMAVALALDAVYDSSGRIDKKNTHSYVPNDYVYNVVQQYPDLLLFGASVNPNREDAIDELERVAHQGAVLIKWVASSQDINPADKRHLPFYRKMADLGLPLLAHTGYEHCVPATDQMYGDPKRLRPALDEGVTVIAAHAGCSGHLHPVEFFDDYVKMLDHYPNLYGDLAAICTLSRFGYARRMTKIDGFFDRHMQATDFPVPPVTSLYLNRIGLKNVARISRITNMFDRDVALKKELGFPDQILYKAAEVLGIESVEFKRKAAQ